MSLITLAPASLMWTPLGSFRSYIALLGTLFGVNSHLKSKNLIFLFFKGIFFINVLTDEAKEFNA